jgi:hypothetical protein
MNHPTPPNEIIRRRDLISIEILDERKLAEPDGFWTTQWRISVAGAVRFTMSRIKEHPKPWHLGHAGWIESL